MYFYQTVGKFKPMHIFSGEEKKKKKTPKSLKKPTLVKNRVTD